MTFPRLTFLPLALAGLALSPSVAHSSSPDASWLPANTVACMVVSDLDRYLTDSKKTVLGQLLESDAMRPFFECVWSTQEKDPFTVPGLLGCTLEEIRKVTQGSLVMAVVSGEGRPPALVLLAATQGRQEQARQLLDQVGARLEKIGGQKTRSSGPEGASVYNLPERYGWGVVRQLAYAVQEGYLIASTRVDVLGDLVARRSGKSASLADDPTFQATTGRALKETPGALVNWFLEPLRSWSAWRTLNGVKIKGQDMLKILNKEGFSALKGFGGAVSIARNGEVQVRGYVRAPRPYQRAMRMLTFFREPVADTPAWVPHSVSLYGRLAIDISTTFEAYSSLFDTLYGEGEPGVFDDVIKGLRDDPVGPKVDVRKELVARLRSPVHFLEVPGKGDAPSKGMLVCPVKEAARVASAVDRFFKGDRGARRVAFGDFGLWEVLPEGVPANGKAQVTPANGKTETGPAMPASAVGVHKDMLLVASSPHTVRQVFSEHRPLAQDADYPRTSAALDRLAGKSASLQLFFRFGLIQRQLLTELRAGKGKTETALGGVLRTLFPADSKRPGGGIYFKKLPSPEDVASLLGGQAGLRADLAEDTWSFVLIVGK